MFDRMIPLFFMFNENIFRNMANINKIRISGTSYDIQDLNAPSVSAVTQQEYDNLPSSAKTSNTFFVITDAQAGDLTQYWTSAQTQSAITQAVSGKQDTLVSGTNIKTINNESILGSGNINIQGGGGGGKAVTGGTNISVTTGETADTINCTLNLVNGGGTDSVKMKNTHSSNGSSSFAIGSDGVKASGLSSFAGGSYSEANGIFSMAFGRYSKTKNYGETAFGFFGISNGSSNAPSQSSGNTLLSVGNGTNAYDGQHNAFEIRQNGDIYLNNGTSDIKLQDYLQIKVVKLTQSAYDQLQTKDPNTLFVIVN